MATRDAWCGLLILALAMANGGGVIPAGPDDRLEELRGLVKAGNHSEAESGARALRSAVEAERGVDSVEAADVLDVLVESLWRGGKAREPEARQLAERAVAIKERVLGPDHPDVAKSLFNLASLLQQVSNYSAARPLYERALAIREKSLGPDHLDVAASLNNLATLLRSMGDYTAARPLFERSLAIREKVLGAEHPDVARSLHNLAILLRDTGDHAAARPLAERSLAIREKVLGPEHPDVAAGLASLATLLGHSGDYAAARPLFERSLAIREKALGPDHPDVAGSLGNLANLASEMGDYAAARPLYERSLAIFEKVLGPDHPGVATGLFNLANLLTTMGDHAAARPLAERSLVIFEKVLGPFHRDVAQSLGMLGSLLVEMGDYTAARSILERSLAIFEKALGPDHPDLATSLGNLANLLRLTGEYAAARPYYERALAVREKALGLDHPYVATSLNNLAILLRQTGDYPGARTHYERALAIREQALGPDHPDVATSLNSLANVFYDLADYAAARPYYERALTVREKALGLDHPYVAMSLNNLANLLWLTGDYAGARPHYERALEIQEKALGADHPLTAWTLNSLAPMLAAQGDATGALDAALEAERIARDHLQLTSRTLSERQALNYAAVRISGLDFALTLAVRGLDASSRRRVLDAVVRSRAVVLDEMAGRHRAARSAADPEVLHLVESLSGVRSRLANLLVRGVGEQKPEVYRRLLDMTRDEVEQAERTLAGASASFAGEQSRTRLGVDDVAASLPPGSVLVSFVRFRSIDVPLQGAVTSDTTAEREKSKGEKKAEPSSGRSTGKPREEASYLAMVMRSGGLDPQVVDLGSAEEIDSLVARWKEEASGGALLAGQAPQQAEAAYREAGTLLRRSVWDPLSSVITDAQRVFVVADGALNLTSVAALPMDDGGYLIEHGPLVHYLSAERDIISSSEVRAGEGLLALGGPAYDTTSLFAALAPGKIESGPGQPLDASVSRQADSSVDGEKATATTPAILHPFRGGRSGCGDFASATFDPLPGAEREAEEVADLWRRRKSQSAVRLTGAAASEAGFKEKGPGRSVLHLATHGFFLGGRCPSALDSTPGAAWPGAEETERAVATASSENPLLLSGLVLAGANHRAAAGPTEEDGILTAEEIAAMDLSGVEWAVLSACDTGRGEIRAGEGVFGLRRAFQVAGARTLIISLWAVEDEAARAWMKALYEGRIVKGLDSASAVHAASLGMLKDRRRRGESTHPFFWAGFVASGDWR